jgi:hypothetical protein
VVSDSGIDIDSDRVETGGDLLGDDKALVDRGLGSIKARDGHDIVVGDPGYDKTEDRGRKGRDEEGGGAHLDNRRGVETMELG